MSVTAVTQNTVGVTNGASAQSQLSNDYQSFLTLLVAQVQNQDPLAPMDSTAFVSQLAQLTQVEQSVQVNTQLESLRQQMALSAALAETGLIGRKVTSPSDSFTLTEEGARFWYMLENTSASVQAQVHDESGNLIAVINDLSGSEGKMIEVKWDGMTDKGLPAQPGRYKVSIAALGEDGKTGAYNSYSDGEVVSIDYFDGLTWLQLADGQRVQSGSIVRAE